MKILIVSQYFWPESFIINDLAICLAELGHTIEIVTGKPNYPDGVFFKGYFARGCLTEYFNETIPVHRVPVYPRGKGGGIRLTLNYLSYIASGLWYFPRFVKTTSFDTILVFAPSPITSVIPAIYLKKRLQLPLAVWVQDLWPESLSATGFVQNRFLLRCVGRLVRWIYRATDTLLVQSQAFKEPLIPYAAEEKIVYYPNSYREAGTQSLVNELIPSDLSLLLESKQCFVFAGNLGTAQSVETLMDAAEQLQHLPDCRLLLIGSGSMSSWLAEQITVRGLDKVILAGRFPSTAMPYVFARAAGLLVTLKREAIFAYTIPSKIQAYLASGRPVIAAIDGEGARIITEANAGFAGAAEDGVALAKNIEKLYYMPEAKRATLGQSGRAYFLKHFEMMSQSKHLIAILEERISKKETV